MKLERVLPVLLLPNIAFAGGGGGAILGLLIFLPVLLWIFVRIWKFWFRMIFGGFNQAVQQQPSQQAISQPTRDCPYCAEPILLKAKKCKHCGSDVT